MEIIKLIAPFDCQQLVDLWADTFGLDEALLEKPQVDGSEKDFNLDIVYIAKENDKILGAIHITQPLNCPLVCGLSGMCTVPAARGKGIGRILFNKIVEQADQLGAVVSYLGTNNPVASKLYHSVGYSFISGSNVMARFAKGDLVDFTKEYFCTPAQGVTVKRGDPSIRIPIIALVLNLTSHVLLDINAKIFSREFITQRSCMGLFPRYLKIEQNGGAYFTATDKNGILGALASVVKTDNGYRADFFYAENFKSSLTNLIEKCQDEFKDVYFEFSIKDADKISVAESLGYKNVGNSEFILDEFLTVPTVIYKK